MRTNIQNEWRPASEGELDLRVIGRSLWSRRVLILALALGAAALAFVVVNLFTPKYKSEARVLVETRENVFLRPNADTSIERTTVDPETVTSQVQIIQSRDLALDVIQQLGLADKPEFDPALRGDSAVQVLLSLVGLARDPAKMTKEERVLRSYYDRLVVFAVDRSRVISIEFESEDPQLAARAANAIADAYLKRQQEAQAAQSKNASQFLAGEIQSLRGKVADAEQKVEAYRANSDLLLGPNGTSLATQQLGDYNAQVAAARAQRAEADGKARLIREALRAGGPIEYNDIVNSELIRRLSEQKVALSAQLAEQSSTLLDQHPRIKELRAQIADLDRQMRGEAERIARSLENESRMAGARVDSLVAGLQQLKKQAAAANSQDVELRALERDAKSQRDLLESYLTKYREATARENVQAASPDARVISRATVSNTPAWPKKVPTVLVAGLAMLVLAMAVVVTGALLGSDGDSVAVVARAREPQLRPRRGLFRRATPAPREAAPTVAEAAAEAKAAEDRALPPSSAPLVTATTRPRTGTIDQVTQELRSGGEQSRRVAVVSAVRDVDSAGTTIALARSLARESRVVALDLSPGSRALDTMVDDAGAAGMSELVRGTASFGDVIMRDRGSSAHVIRAGSFAEGQASMPESPRLGTILEALARTYDYVVVHAAAVPDADVRALARMTPRAVLVTTALEDATAIAARDRLLNAGFTAVTVMSVPRGPDATEAARARAA